MAQHRDLHPGNIILQEGEIDWRARRSKDFFVKIIDWGQAYSAFLPMHDDSPDFSFILHKNIGREFTASFYSAPPEVFLKPLEQHLENYDSWALGLLLYKILTHKDAFVFEGIGDYVSAVINGQIEGIARARKAIVAQLETPHAALLSEVFYRLIKVNPHERMNVQIVERVMWDLRIENFVPRDHHELHSYLLNPSHYEPAEGWRFSSKPEYD
jgi:serine/threonine protein kinase